MKKLKIVTIVGTRPEIIKLSCVIKLFEKFFDHILIHTGQNYDYELNQIFFDDLGISKPDLFLKVVGENLGQTMGNIISYSYDELRNIQPDAVVVLGDTNSCLSVIAAKRLKIPIFHLEAGNRCKDENLPEEVLRRIIDVTSDVNLCYSDHARRYILDCGVKSEYTFVIGSPMREVLKENETKIDSSKILTQLSLERKKYLLISAHREENIDIEDNFLTLMNSLNTLSELYNLPLIFGCHPRTLKRINQSNIILHSNIRLHKPFGFFDYLKLQKNAYCVISDSGTLPEEASILNFPAVSIRTSSERPEALDSGTFIIGSLESNKIIQSINLAVDLQKLNKPINFLPAYIDENVAMKVVKLVQSYTPIINKFVWRKKEFNNG